MEHEGSLLQSQLPATFPYPEPVRSSPKPHIPLPENPSKYYSPIYAWIFQVVSLPQIYQLKFCIRLSSPPYVLHALSITFFPIFITRTIFGKEYRSLSSLLCNFLHSTVTGGERPRSLREDM